jgi:hypothetical protein
MEKHRVKFTSLNEPTIWFAVFYWERRKFLNKNL